MVLVLFSSLFLLIDRIGILIERLGATWTLAALGATGHIASNRHSMLLLLEKSQWQMEFNVRFVNVFFACHSVLDLRLHHSGSGEASGAGCYHNAPNTASRDTLDYVVSSPVATHTGPCKDGAASTQLFHMPYNLAAVSYDRGVLQETVMHVEIFITRLFDGLRLLLRTLLLLPPQHRGIHHNASKPPRHRRSSFHEMVRLHKLCIAFWLIMSLSMGGTCYSHIKPFAVVMAFVLPVQKHISSRRACAPDGPFYHLHRSKSTGAVDQVPRKQQEQASGDVSVATLIRACGYPAGASQIHLRKLCQCLADNT